MGVMNLTVYKANVIRHAEPGKRHKRCFRCVSFYVKHRFAEKRVANLEAVEPANHLMSGENFDRVRYAQLMERHIRSLHFSGDPSIVIERLIMACFGTGTDDTTEVGVIAE